MIDKIVGSFDEAVADLFSGAVLHVGGFISPNYAPSHLLAAVARKGVTNLTIISTAMGVGTRRAQQYAEAVRIPGDAVGVGLLVERRQVAKGITSFPGSNRGGGESPFEKQLRRGEVEVELIGQGSLAERIRAARAGIAAFYTPVGAGTTLAAGKDVREFDGRPYLLETALPADFALIRAHRADRYGNLVYRGPPSFNGTMAGAARVTIAEVDELAPLGALDAHDIRTPGVYVQRVVLRPAKPAASWEEPC
jgi:3-oxoacid CoA-transferase A subunit